MTGKVLPDARKYSLPPVCDAGCNKLILGSLPGDESLRKQQYYAYPANHFWPLVHEIYGAKPAPDYDARLRFLLERRIALWDVLSSARRPGSLDQSIADEEPNDFETMLACYPAIGSIFFNGTKARDVFVKWFPREAERRRCVLLPSSSPIPGKNRAYDNKRTAWSVIART